MCFYVDACVLVGIVVALCMVAFACFVRVIFVDAFDGRFCCGVMFVCVRLDVVFMCYCLCRLACLILFCFDYCSRFFLNDSYARMHANTVTRTPKRKHTRSHLCVFKTFWCC